MIRPYRLITTIVMGVALGAQSQAMTLNDFLAQVKERNLSYQGSADQATGAVLKAREADLIFSPNLFAEARAGQDAKPNTPPMKMYDEMKTQNYSLGLKQQFSFGLQAKLSYDLNKTDFVNASSALNPTSYWDATPKLELTMPLWGNGFGRAAVANETVLREQNIADQFSSKGQADSLLAQAETTYWSLSAWLDAVKIQQQALQAAQNIYEYVAKKRRMNLGEEADVVQAQALVEARTLELQVARNQADEFQRSLNRFLNQDSNTPVGDLEKLDYKSLESISVPQVRTGDLAEVKAAEAQLAAAKASSVLVYERNRPTLDVYGTYAMNGRDETTSEAMKNAGRDDLDTAFVGVRLNVPLNLAAASDAKVGALKTERAADLKNRYAQYNQEQAWVNLTRSLQDARDNLRLLSRIETAQKAKLDTERTRLRQGRTTTYQVLLFEQDYSQAAISKVKSAVNILSLQSQIKLYQEPPKGAR